MGPKFKREFPVYVIKENSFVSIGVLDEGVLTASASDIVDMDILKDVKVELKLSLRSRIRLMGLFKKRKKIDIFGRIWDAILVTFEGLKYQLTHKN